MTASSQSVSSFSTCSMARSASLYRWSTQTRSVPANLWRETFCCRGRFYSPSCPWAHCPGESVPWASLGPAEWPVRHPPGPGGTAPGSSSNKTGCQRTYSNTKIAWEFAHISLVIVPINVPVILWITFDCFCKQSHSLCVLSFLHQLYPFFCSGKKWKNMTWNLRFNTDLRDKILVNMFGEFLFSPNMFLFYGWWNPFILTASLLTGQRFTFFPFSPICL